jgi:hypothetical protein
VRPRDTDTAVVQIIKKERARRMYRRDDGWRPRDRENDDEGRAGYGGRAEISIKRAGTGRGVGVQKSECACPRGAGTGECMLGGEEV